MPGRIVGRKTVYDGQKKENYSVRFLFHNLNETERTKLLVQGGECDWRWYNIVVQELVQALNSAERSSKAE